MEYFGEMETHVTVRLKDAADVNILHAWGAQRGLKCVHIVLAAGRTPSQPMLTRRRRGQASEERAWAEELACALAAEGFQATRIKVEAAPWCAGVPQSDAEALDARRPPEACFEHHLKLLLEADADLASLADLARSRGAHLSRNALKTRPDGRTERFVTQRCYAVGRPAAARRLAELQGDLEALFAVDPFRDRRILDVEEEYVVYDSRLDLDAGWLDAVSASASASDRLLT